MPIFFRWIFKINCSIVVLQYIVYTLVVYISLDKPKWKNVNEFDPSSVKNRSKISIFFDICQISSCCFYSFFLVGTSESIRFFSIFQTRRIYMLSLGPIYHHCLRFPLHIYGGIYKPCGHGRGRGLAKYPYYHIRLIH